jgi:hypothetical protein
MRSARDIENITAHDTSSRTDYYTMSDQTELDEESINWWAFGMRVLALAMLVLIIILVGAGALSKKFWLLAGILSVGLILVIVLSYYNFKCCYNRYVCAI